MDPVLEFSLFGWRFELDFLPKIRPRIQLYPWTYRAPISRVKSPQLPMYKAIYKGYNSIYD